MEEEKKRHRHYRRKGETKKRNESEKLRDLIQRRDKTKSRRKIAV